jgi:hypothetical protein
MTIKKVKAKGFKKISSPNIEVKNYDYPIFCFKHLHKDFHLDKCTSLEKQRFLDRIVSMSQISWQVLQCSDRHKMGSEKISIDSLHCEVPHSLTSTEDVKSLLAFRFDEMKPFVGFRNGFIFHVLYIDRDFTLYKH